MTAQFEIPTMEVTMSRVNDEYFEAISAIAKLVERDQRKDFDPDVLVEVVRNIETPDHVFENLIEVQSIPLAATYMMQACACLTRDDEDAVDDARVAYHNAARLVTEVDSSLGWAALAAVGEYFSSLGYSARS
jgi:hypothetical protein